MLFWLLVLGFLFGLYKLGKCVYKDEGISSSIIVVSLAGTFVSILFYELCCICIPIIVNNVHDISTSEYYYDDVVFLKNHSDDRISGGGNFLYWTIDGEGVQEYVITLKKDDGYIKKVVDAESVYVMESDSISPRLVYKDKYIKVDFPWWISTIDINVDVSFKPYQIVVPTGTVIKKINQI